MTAAELVAYLHAHPVVCERLGITLGTTHGIDYIAVDATFDSLGTDDSQEDADFFRRWLLGAFSDWGDENGIAVCSNLDDAPRTFAPWGWIDFSAKDATSRDFVHPSRLHAYVAAMEARP